MSSRALEAHIRCRGLRVQLGRLLSQSISPDACAVPLEGFFDRLRPD
jgi:hypothetical protein